MCFFFPYFSHRSSELDNARTPCSVLPSLRGVVLCPVVACPRWKVHWGWFRGMEIVNQAEKGSLSTSAGICSVALSHTPGDKRSIPEGLVIKFARIFIALFGRRCLPTHTHTHFALMCVYLCVGPLGRTTTEKNGFCSMDGLAKCQ